MARKTGRHYAEHVGPNGDRLVGLSHLYGNRWRISQTGERFRGSEAEAIRRYHAAMDRLRQQDQKLIPIREEPTSDVLQKGKGGPDGQLTVVGPGSDIAKAYKEAREAGGKIHIRIVPGGKTTTSIAVHGPAFWAEVGRLLEEEPKLVAAKTGVPWVAWGPSLKPPGPSATLDELIEAYAAKPGLSGDEVTRIKRFWGEFASIVPIKTIGELTHDHVAEYERRINAKIVDGKPLGPKSIKHRFSRVRTVIAYGLRRGKGEECRKALDVLAMLEVPEGDSLDPNPISPTDFGAILAAARKAKDATFAALLIAALNFAMYPGEIGAVRWDEIELDRGEFAARRHKTAVPRVAVLWPETLAAIKALPRARAQIFCTRVQAYNRFSTHRDWTKYRLAAKVEPGVTFNRIRDAAFTIACRVSLDQARVLAGHRLPGAVDHYVLRQPQFVKDACAAIRSTFLKHL